MSDNNYRFAAKGEDECGARSELVPGFGYLYCELKRGHGGAIHREREEGLVWEVDK